MSEALINTKIQKAVLRYARIAPRKARLVANLIKGLSVNEAEAQLIYNTKRASKIILKLIQSAKAGALAKKFDLNKLYVKNILVNQGPMFKRYLPRARGVATPIQKKTSHIEVILIEKDNVKPKYTIIQNKKSKVKKEALKQFKEKKDLEQNLEDKKQKKSQEGFFKKFFRRKSV
ncbi:MAG: 50S ribosomal protein L22 [Patescibacteria group bacterium]|nr:50S ribosomal protein L22 [Patescibacteria group bacterium]MCX7589898.1 50S ribosomal protein L22 [Patescibacteria group bacterium]